MSRFLFPAAFALLLCAGCDQTTKDTATTETTRTGADGNEVKTETTVEKKTTVDK